MSTENEGAAATPAAGPAPTPPAVPGTDSDGRTADLRGAADEARSARTADSVSGADSGSGPAPGADGGAGPPVLGTSEQAAAETPPGSTTPMPPVTPPMAAAPPPPGPGGPPPSPGQPGGGGHFGQWGTGAHGSVPYGGDSGSPGGPVGPGQPYDPWGAPPPDGPPPGRRRISGGLVAVVAVVALVAAGLGGGIGFLASSKSEGGTTTISSGSDTKTLNRSPKSVAGIAAKALPSVVTIETAGGGEKGTGTGFVYDKQGHILTNNHVVASAAQGSRLTATFSDGKKYSAEIVGRAEGYDVAVIKLKNASGRKLSPLPLGKSDNVAVGDATIAIGAPYGLSGTVTTGIVSAKNRPVASSDGQSSKASYMNALQTDASINPGNSGGPLLNAQGGVIGINSAIQPGGSGGGGLGGGQGQSGSVGLGFAIPVSQAQRVATQLIKTGTPVYPVIGATVTMSQGGAQGPEQGGNGAVIAGHGENGSDAVTKGGPADKAGLKSGDVITKLNDTHIDSGPTLIGTIWTHKPGEKVNLTYKRGGKEHTTEVTLGSRKGDGN